MIRRLDKPAIAASVAFVALVLALFSFAYVGHFTRYMADDYCLANQFRNAGFWRFQSIYYFGWTGRFSYLFLVALIKPLEPTVVPFLGSSLILIWLVIAIWTVYQIALLVSWPSPLRTAGLVGAVFVFTMVNSSQNIVQTYYWLSGLLGYATSIILATVTIGIMSFAWRVSQHRRSGGLIASLFLLTLFVGGLSEPYTFLQTAVFLFALAICFWRGSSAAVRNYLPLLVSGLAGSIVALALVVLAPGNLVRQSHFEPPPNLFKLIWLTLYYSAGFVAYTVYLSPLTTVMVAFFFAMFGGYSHLQHGVAETLQSRTIVRSLLIIPLMGFLMICASMLPPAYGISHIMPPRAQIIPQLVFVITTACWSYLAGVLLARKFASSKEGSKKLYLGAVVVACSVIILSPVTATWRTLRLIPGASSAAATWDRIDQNLRAARTDGLRDITVPANYEMETRSGAPQNELHVEANPNTFKNKCVAEYYGVNSISAK